MSKKISIKQVWVPYWLWEDWVNGMWAKGDESRINEAVNFTGDWQRYGNAMLDVVFAWPNTMLNSLTNSSINQRAFLGHCAVSYATGIQESITRCAWKLLTDQQRYDADKIAQKTIDAWKEDYVDTLRFGKLDVIQKGYRMKLHKK